MHPLSALDRPVPGGPHRLWSWARQSFEPWISRHAVDYIQPDVTKCGGLSEEYKIAMMACGEGSSFPRKIVYSLVITR